MRVDLSCTSRATKRRAGPTHHRRHIGHRILLLSTLLLASDGNAQAIYKNENFDYSYRNVKRGYTITYPVHWQPSGNAYSNAFEIRNYDTQAPEDVPERNRASVIVVDTINEHAGATEAFLNGLDATPPFCLERLSIDAHRAVRVINRIPAQPLAPGATRAQPGQGDATFYLCIDLYIANGKHLISIEARVPVGADAAVLEDILRIEDSVKFQAGEDR